MGTHIHIVGIAGVGMSALAQAAQWCGFTVSGSDRYLDQGTPVDVLKKLARCGISLHPQDGSGVTSRTAGVVVSTAIEDDNPDLVAARQQQVPVMHRSRFLTQLMGDHTCLAVAGTSGKTTVTGMIGWILEWAGKDPFVINGGSVTAWQDEEKVGSVRAGKSDLWVIEADESDKSFLHYTPQTAIITNISHDHFNLPETIELFAAFTKQVKGKIICGTGVRDMLSACDSAIRDKLIEPECTCDHNAGTGFTWHGDHYSIPVLGEHNARNAFLAMVLCHELGVSSVLIRQALQAFPGIERRLQIVGYSKGTTIIDDYAHNPAKISASWLAVQSTCQRVLGVWRPHGFGPLKAMQQELIKVFRDVMRKVDQLYILPVYYVGGTTTRSVTSAAFVQSLKTAGVNAVYVPDYATLQVQLMDIMNADDTILCMGARDPDLPRFAQQLCDH